MEVHPEELFTEPGGWESARIFFIAAVVFSIFGGIELLSDTGTNSAVILAIGMGLAGVAELLPIHRRRLAIGLRVASIGVVLSFVFLSLIRLVA